MSDAKDAARAERLKAALRENLKRRKAQARGRENPSGAGGEEPASGNRDQGKRQGGNPELEQAPRTRARKVIDGPDSD